MTPITVETATWRDAAAVFKLRRALDEETAALTKIPNNETDDMMMAQLYETMGWFYDPNRVIYITKNGAETTGYIAALGATYVGRTSGVSVCGLYVVPSARMGASISLLIKAVTKAAVDSQSLQIQAVVMSGNTRMEKALTRMGFKAVAQVYDREVNHGRIVRQ